MTISSNSQTNWFAGVDNLDQSWYTTLANSVTNVATNIGDLMYDGGSGAAYPAGEQSSQGSEAADQALFAKTFLGCATEGVLAAETNVNRQIVVRTRGAKWFKCPSTTWTIGQLVGIYSDGSDAPDPTQVDAVSNPSSCIGVVIPVPGNPGYYASAVTEVYVYFSSRLAGENLALQQLYALPDYQYATGTTTTTFTAGELTGAKFNVYNSTATTPGSIATRTAALMFGDVPNAYVGMSFITRIINSSASANTMTITAGTNVTLSGITTYTIAEYAYRDFLITFTSATTATMKAIGGGAAATN